MKSSHPELKEIRIVSEDTLGERQVFHLVFTSLGRVFGLSTLFRTNNHAHFKTAS